MIKVSSQISNEILDEIDICLNEIAPSNWSVYQDRITLDANLVGYFENNKKQHEIIEEFKLYFDAILDTSYDDLVFNFIEDKDWAESYKSHFKPWRHKDFHWIPLWLKEEYKNLNKKDFVLLDPGMAFGTGNHETTRLCLQAIIDLRKNNQNPLTLFDIGCGSGIISITGSKLGYLKIFGVDNDSDAVRISKENALLNQVSNVKFEQQNLKFYCSHNTFDIVVANIQSDVLIEQNKEIINSAKSDSTILLSGILKKEVHTVQNAFDQEIRRRRMPYKSMIIDEGEWSLIQYSIGNNFNSYPPR